MRLTRIKMAVSQVKQEVQALINSAANADEKGDLFDAYKKYMKVVEYISQVLQMDSSEKVTENCQLKQKLLSYAKHCIERAQDILDMWLQAPPTDHPQQAPPSHHPQQAPPSHHPQQAPPSHHSQQTPPSHHPQQAPPSHHPQQAPPSHHPQQAPPSHHPQQAPPSHHSQQAPPSHHPQQAPPSHHPQQGPPSHHPQAWPSHPQYSTFPSLTESSSMSSGPSPGASLPLASPTRSQLSPVEQAKERNRQLMALYQEKLQRSLQRGTSGTQRMTLSTLRRLEENLSIAKAKEQSLRMKARRLLKLKQAQFLDGSSAVGRAKSDPDTLAREVSSYERLRARYLKLRAKLLRPPINPKTVLALLNEALRDKNHPLYMEFGKLQFPILLQLQPLLKELDQLRFLPWIGSGSTHASETEGPPMGPEMFRISLSHSPTATDQSQSPSASVEEEEEAADSQEVMAVSPSTTQQWEGAEHNFDDKLAALKASLLSEPTATPPDSSPVEGDVSESQLLHNLGAAPESSPYEFQFLLRPPSPVATADLSDSDLKEVFGETAVEPQSMDGTTPVSTGACTGSPTGGGTGNSGVVCTGGDSVGDEGGICARSPTMTGCAIVGQPQSGWLHVSKEQEKMVVLQAHAVEHLQGIVHELQAALGTLLHAILTAYRIPEEEQGNIREAIEPTVEQGFFPPLWPHLIKAFRLKHYDGEVALATNMALLHMCAPEDLHVKEKFCLRKEPGVAYGPVINDLIEMMSLSCPSDKLATLVRASKSVFQCIEDYYNKFEGGQCPKQSSIGVDDLLPIICYISVSTGLPQILSELAALQEFISDSYLMGEDGFCLTTFHTAVEYLKAMSPDSRQPA